MLRNFNPVLRHPQIERDDAFSPEARLIHRHLPAPAPSALNLRRGYADPGVPLDRGAHPGTSCGDINEPNEADDDSSEPEEEEEDRDAADIRRQLAIEAEIRHQQREAEAAVMRGALGRLGKSTVPTSSPPPPPPPHSAAPGAPDTGSSRSSSSSSSSNNGNSSCCDSGAIGLVGMVARDNEEEEDDEEEDDRPLPLFGGSSVRFPDRYSPYASRRRSRSPGQASPAIAATSTPAVAGVWPTRNDLPSLLADDLALRFRQSFQQQQQQQQQQHQHQQHPPHHAMHPHHGLPGIPISRHGCCTPPPPHHLHQHHQHHLHHLQQHLPAQQSSMPPLAPPTASSHQSHGALTRSDSAPDVGDLQTAGSSSPGHHWTFEEQFKQVGGFGAGIIVLGVVGDYARGHGSTGETISSISSK